MVMIHIYSANQVNLFVLRIADCISNEMSNVNSNFQFVKFSMPCRLWSDWEACFTNSYNQGWYWSGSSQWSLYWCQIHGKHISVFPCLFYSGDKFQNIWAHCCLKDSFHLDCKLAVASSYSWDHSRKKERKISYSWAMTTWFAELSAWLLTFDFFYVFWVHLLWEMVLYWVCWKSMCTYHLVWPI